MISQCVCKNIRLQRLALKILWIMKITSFYIHRYVFLVQLHWDMFHIVTFKSTVVWLNVPPVRTGGACRTGGTLSKTTVEFEKHKMDYFYRRSNVACLSFSIFPFCYNEVIILQAFFYWLRVGVTWSEVWGQRFNKSFWDFLHFLVFLCFDKFRFFGMVVPQSGQVKGALSLFRWYFLK